ncbi:hypothetical protein J008_05217 [Cryptococcus neoformans]|nr:hypothetical protein C367_00002 [Cryptococcus neoformans var. grubii Ze90-1]OXH25925.1 hypothetical protein J008_05217 [Cryptococcus neoformans var. grubii]
MDFSNNRSYQRRHRANASGASFVIKYIFLPCLSDSQTTPGTSIPLSNVYSDQTSGIAVAYDHVPRATSMLHSQESASNDTATVLSAHLLVSNPLSATSIAGFILEKHHFLAVPPHLAIGDLSSMWYLMSFHPQMDMAISMALSMTAGISTSIMLETALLHLGKDRMPLTAAARTAFTLGLSDNSMTLASKEFWLMTCVSMMAGYLVPLPYNYIRLKLWGKACH